MPSDQSTKLDESPTLSASAQKVWDAMERLDQLSEEQVEANRQYNLSLPRPTPESIEAMKKELLENLRRNSMRDSD